ncbi:MAG TPA: hypothetical protein VGP83_17245 [Pyrinomonadaceae bacterium]|jgi:hypothetical protein|nr:hypothetical protein [Pyrinomonadaceae bacterium]
MYERVSTTKHNGELHVEVRAICEGGCNRTFDFLVPLDDWQKWQSGALIQVALKSVHKDLRELLISGLCGSCFDNLMSEE